MSEISLRFLAAVAFGLFSFRNGLTHRQSDNSGSSFHRPMSSEKAHPTV